MAAVVSHAMRRFPLTPPDAAYSYSLRGEGSAKSWSQAEEGSSALSRSMRYADPWLYGSVRAPSGLVLAPAFVLCACSDYINGTKRSSKKGPTTCKKCKGARLPLSPSDITKFGTVRCYPTAAAAAGSAVQPLRAGTVRVSSSSRPSILPSGDPYDLMRRSRLSTSESSSQFRARSVSPNKARTGDGRSHSASRTSKEIYSTLGRKSILECDINPYELISSSETQPKDASITLVNGQRIRVRPPSIDYEDVQLRKPQQKPQSPQKPLATKALPLPSPSPPPPPPPPQKTNEKESECNNNNNRFKSILKKRTTTFSDTDLERREASPSPAHPRSGSHFYLPMPGNTPRKKVQFLVENELVCQEPNNRKDEPSRLDYAKFEDTLKEESKDEKDEALPHNTNTNTSTDEVSGEVAKKICKLRRSESERFSQGPKKVLFHDTMALRTRSTKGDSRIIFAEKDLQRLDGLIPRTRKISPPTPRPSQPPPPPPETTNADDEKLKEPEAVVEERMPEPKNDEIKINNDTVREEKIEMSNTPPSAPPRKRSNNKQPVVVGIIQTKQTVKIESSPPSNRTVVQINGTAVHKLQIKNEFSASINVQTVPVLESPQRKTSIMINGDDCYSTVNVNDDVPLYQSSVVVNDIAVDATLTRPNKKSSSVYITGNFTSSNKMDAVKPTETPSLALAINNTENEEIPKITGKNSERNSNILIDTFNENNIPSSELLKELLKDPVEAVRRNLVPHVCGKSNVIRRQLNLDENVLDSSMERCSILDLKTYESLDNCSEHSSSTQYELMDNGSECYTDHSNRSSVTEEELTNRTKFYELLADSAVVEVSENEDHHYESIKTNQDPIYEEIEIPPPLPANPPPTSLLDDLQLDKEYTTRSIFEGASKYDILSYLVDAKERGIVQEDNYSFSFTNEEDVGNNRASHMSTVSDSSEDNSLIMANTLIDDKATFQKAAEVERNDSGVGSETSKSSLSKYRVKQETSVTCEDCETVIDSSVETEPLICRKCVKKRSERKEIITEIVETEEKYSRDLQIILEEFYQPMLVAGLLTPDQLSAIFLNAEELLENSQSLAERLRDAVEIAIEQGDEDLLTVNIGKLFLEAAPMLHGFETYCVRQGAASLLLASLEKDKELLRIFLRVSQMENTMLRRMNLNSFLMVPVQRVTKYPLLLARLYKVTPSHHETKEQLKEAQHKIELHLNHMNSETKDVPSKLWRRIGSSSGRRSSTEMDLVNIKLRKIAVDVLEWNHDEAKFALEGKLLYTQPTDNNWRKGRTIKLAPVNALLVINGKSTTNRPERGEENGLIFSRFTAAREAALLLVRDKNGRYSLLREPLYLDRCIIAADPAWQSYFEVQELLGKDTFIFKAEDEDQTRTWYNQLQYHAQGMGAWRKRRNALANIMINGMGLRT